MKNKEQFSAVLSRSPNVHTYQFLKRFWTFQNSSKKIRMKSIRTSTCMYTYVLVCSCIDLWFINSDKRPRCGLPLAPSPSLWLPARLPLSHCDRNLNSHTMLPHCYSHHNTAAIRVIRRQSSSRRANDIHTSLPQSVELFLIILQSVAVLDLCMSLSRFDWIICCCCRFVSRHNF